MIWRCKELLSDVRSHSLYYCESVMPEIRSINPLVNKYEKDTSLTINDKELLSRLLTVFKTVDNDLVKRWEAEDPRYQFSDYAQLHRRLKPAIESIELLIEKD